MAGTCRADGASSVLIAAAAAVKAYAAAAAASATFDATSRSDWLQNLPILLASTQKLVSLQRALPTLISASR